MSKEKNEDLGKIRIELGDQVDVWDTSKERKYDLGKVG